ncbi:MULTISPECIES: uracil-DNA glycosylase [Flavobacteriaceae]|uniref:Uracil-DNA glycosylase n=2 Tax=Flavobacteriaceae TaxID=49546 RepID=A0A4Y8AVH6_9FLAO|nr:MULTISPECIES: uracil-DNA glycosylase [Flavobacteriaceae]TEW75483.1 uracil-DNA glycosylase [Gramella jeungdoensis]GGK45578.1 uracil-DNA glycosylase 2 [Lutibacter litoralis]
MKIEIATSWREILDAELKKSYFEELTMFVRQEYETNLCFPPENKLFEAFNLCPFEDLKVVIIGQDPYHDVGQAHGLCFSVNDGVKHPPSLINIFKEIEADLNIPYPISGSLERWAKQGVLLLNATLSVRAHKAGSHQKKGWEQFTDAVISKVSKEHEHVVFLLWGGFAKKKGLKIDTSKHFVLTSGHPSPLSANRGYWFGNKHFSKANSYLENNNLPIINW